jgi:hypothetical protein
MCTRSLLCYTCVAGCAPMQPTGSPCGRIQYTTAADACNGCPVTTVCCSLIAHRLLYFNSSHTAIRTWRLCCTGLVHAGGRPAGTAAQHAHAAGWLPADVPGSNRCCCCGIVTTPSSRQQTTSSWYPSWNPRVVSQDADKCPATECSAACTSLPHHLNTGMACEEGGVHTSAEEHVGYAAVPALLIASLLNLPVFSCQRPLPGAQTSWRNCKYNRRTGSSDARAVRQVQAGSQGGAVVLMMRALGNQTGGHSRAQQSHAEAAAQASLHSQAPMPNTWRVHQPCKWPNAASCSTCHMHVRGKR